MGGKTWRLAFRRPSPSLRLKNASDPSESFRLAPYKFTGATMIIALRAPLSTRDLSPGNDLWPPGAGAERVGSVLQR